MHVNGDIWEGNWCDGRMHGEGMYSKHGNVLYMGQFRNNLYHGQGKMTDVNGDIWEGMWRDGLMHGEGVYSKLGGPSSKGQWYHGMLIGMLNTFTIGGETYEIGIRKRKRKCEDVNELHKKKLK